MRLKTRLRDSLAPRPPTLRHRTFGMPLFACSQASGTESGGTKKRRGEDGEGGGYGLTARELEELAVRTAQVVSLHDIAVRELSMVWRKVKMPQGSTGGKALMEVHEAWRVGRAKSTGSGGGSSGTGMGGSKHLRLAVVVLEMLYGWKEVAPAVRTTLEKRWEGKDQTTPEFLGTDVRHMKWQPLKNGKEGILTFGLVPELMEVEKELVRMLEVLSKGEVVVGVAPKGPQIREMEGLIEGTWRKDTQ